MTNDNKRELSKPENNNDPTPHLRDVAEHIEDIGPEDESAEETMEGLEEYGYDVWSEGNLEGAYTNQSDQPQWMNRDAEERSNIVEDTPRTGEKDDRT